MCTELRLSTRPDGPEIRETRTRRVGIDALIERAAAHCSHARADSDQWPPSSTAPLPRAFLPENFEAARRVHRENRANVRRARTGRPRVTERPSLRSRSSTAGIDEQPTKAVQTAFGVSPRTAARYVQVCRSDGDQLLPKTEQGKKKA